MEKLTQKKSVVLPTIIFFCIQLILFALVSYIIVEYFKVDFTYIVTDGYSLYLAILLLSIVGFMSLFVFARFLMKRASYNEQAFLVAEEILKEQDFAGKMLVRRDLELSRKNEELREFDRMKSEFISVAAHQLRTPLSGIKWTLNMLINGDIGPITNEQKVFLMKTYESNDRMINLVNDLLGLDKMESGGFKYNFVPTQIFYLIDNILFDILIQANKKKIKVEFLNNKQDFPQVLVDQEKMRQVLQNLLENAVKYTPENGRVSIDVAKTGDDFITVSIADTGIGIPKEEEKNIFKRFFRGTNAVAHEPDGSGLGLFISKMIITEHHGTIWFEGNQGGGTVFHISLPIYKGTS